MAVNVVPRKDGFAVVTNDYGKSETISVHPNEDEAHWAAFKHIQDFNATRKRQKQCDTPRRMGRRSTTGKEQAMAKGNSIPTEITDALNNGDQMLERAAGAIQALVLSLVHEFSE